MRVHLALGLSLLWGTLGSCGGGGQGSSSQRPDGPYESGTDGELLDPPGVGDDSSSTPDSTSLGGRFRYGINGGFPNRDWADPVLAELEVSAGCNSQRLSLPERHLERWGYGIELGDMQEYEVLGLDGQVAFLSAPAREHSTAPASAEDWELAHYLPRNLYEPILRDDGSINPDNYWGSYVYETVRTYKDYVKVWEVWNEPDYVSDWSATLEWDERAPSAADLIRFGGSIFDYVRMLRVSKVAAQLADPEAKIATGGIGYPSFLGAILRYTDNPDGGQVSERYPYTGGAYIDVLSFHHYPIYGAGSSDVAVEAYLEHRAELLAQLDEAGASVEGWQTTESGAPRVAVGSYPGSEAYARNYLMKLMVRAQTAGIDGIDWFVLSDGTPEEQSEDPYASMGLYHDVAELEDPEQAILTDTGVAYATLGGVLGRARFDPTTTASLALPDGVQGAAFVTRDERPALALWAIAGAEGESASAVVTLEGNWSVHEWDHSRTGEATTVAAGAPITLSASVRLLVAD